MLRINQILVGTITLAASAVGLTACGQPGALYLPTVPAAANRASLPETLLPGAVIAPKAPAPSPPAPAPASTPSSQ